MTDLLSKIQAKKKNNLEALKVELLRIVRRDVEHKAQPSDPDTFAEIISELGKVDVPLSEGTATTWSQYFANPRNVEQALAGLKNYVEQHLAYRHGVLPKAPDEAAHKAARERYTKAEAEFNDARQALQRVIDDAGAPSLIRNRRAQDLQTAQSSVPQFIPSDQKVLAEIFAK